MFQTKSGSNQHKYWVLGVVNDGFQNVKKCEKQVQLVTN